MKIDLRKDSVVASVVGDSVVWASVRDLAWVSVRDSVRVEEIDHSAKLE